MFYRHKAALMYDHKSLAIAVFWSEIPFIMLVSLIFTVCFYFPLGKPILSLCIVLFSCVHIRICLARNNIMPGFEFSLYDCTGFAAVASKFFYFCLFVFLNVALWTFVGQVSIFFSFLLSEFERLFFSCFRLVPTFFFLCRCLYHSFAMQSPPKASALYSSV